ncbi:MAG: aldehyde dehydrogenase family protein [Bacteroidia bacterium]|nr:aldehyde dehydrogenase family protein [Bacteroidia bacterium]
MKIINPATHEVITTVSEDDKLSIDKKVNEARIGQQKWNQVPLADRIAILQKFASLLQQNIEECALVLTSEVGKPLQQSRNEVNGACARIEWLTANALSDLSDEWMVSEGATREKIAYEPLGVVCNISAWNYPYLVGTNVFVPALLAGNSVVYKPSELATLTGLQIEKYLHQAGVPKDAFTIAIGAREVGELLLEADLDGYFFTGSYATGKSIYEKVSKKMKPCGLELGGKDPLYVADDVADVNTVAVNTADGVFYNNGQSCCSVERIYVHEKVYDAYVAAFVAEVKTYSFGSPTAEGVYCAALTREEQPAYLASQVKDAVSKGAKLLCGGKIVSGEGNFFEPTVLVDVNHTMEVMREESFGPIIGIMKVRSDQEALALMNDTQYGLTAAVFTSDENRALTLMNQLNAGTTYWNCCDRVSAALPWSGRKHSGFGSTLSHVGLRTFTQPKAYHLRS